MTVDAVAPAVTTPAGRLYADLATPTSRLVRATTPPNIADLDPGDLVICEDEWGIGEFINDAATKGVHVRTGMYRFERERVISERRRRGVNVDYLHTIDASRQPLPGGVFDPKVVQASTDAFALTWDALSTPRSLHVPYEPARNHLPEAMVPFLPFDTLNPAQVQAAPLVCSNKPAMIVAPTGAGKTVIGMIAALHEIQTRGQKAAWLVPQRSLTAELDRELARWREQGLKVVALSGETITDSRAAREADLWVATTEKFEALCRASSMRQAVAQVGTLIVDEIHLLGEPGRGPLLETLLARVRGNDSPVRLVGLSATAANADQVAAWLGARLLTIAWRPTRLTQQVLTIPSGSRSDESRWRNAAAVTVVNEITSDGGSVLVFCGTKVNVRSAALAIAAARGVNIRDVNINDVEAVHAATRAAKVGLHYSDWPHKNDAETRFRDRDIDVLVATSTLAAGVNTPARAVVVRDTSIGPQPMEVSMVQQMFGRAGRAGKEPEGWSFLVATLNEAGRWRRRLADGYTIRSGILAGVEDHLLGEIVQGNITSREQAQQWWLSTLAYHQGNDSTQPLTKALDYLSTWHLIDAPATGTVTTTRLGAVTSKMMVGVRDAVNILAALTKAPTSRSHVTAEDTLIETLSAQITSLSSGPDAPPEHATKILSMLAARGEVAKIVPTAARGRDQAKATSAQVAQAGLLLLARTPRVWAARSRDVAGVPRALFSPVLHDTPRYLAWVTAAAELGALPAWTAVVAHDLAPRVTWHHLGPERGSGRLLAWCETLANPRRRATEVPSLFAAARRAGVGSPEQWSAATAPEHVTADRIAAAASLARKAPVTRFAWDAAAGRWTRRSGDGARGLAVMFQGGDVTGTGWLEPFRAAKH